MTDLPPDPPHADDLPDLSQQPAGPPPGIFTPPAPADEAGQDSWVPQRAAEPATANSAALGQTSPTQAAAGGFESAGGPSIKPWQFLLGLAVVFVPLLVWLVVSLTGRDSGPDPIAVSDPSAASPAPSATPPARPTASVRATRSYPPLVVSPRPSSTRTLTRTTRPVDPSPPALSPAPNLKITALPKGAKTLRFEAVASGGAPIEVSLRDDVHERTEYPAKKSAVAIEIPLSKADQRDYYSLSARVPYDYSYGSNAKKRPDVLCRVLVDGVLMSSQQRQGYASCYISVKYELKRS